MADESDMDTDITEPFCSELAADALGSFPFFRMNRLAIMGRLRCLSGFTKCVGNVDMLLPLPFWSRKIADASDFVVPSLLNITIFDPIYQSYIAMTTECVSIEYTLLTRVHGGLQVEQRVRPA